MDTMPYYVKLINLVAQSYEGRDWHELSRKEQEVVAMLIARGHIEQNVPANGFVGKAVIKTSIQ